MVFERGMSLKRIALLLFVAGIASAIVWYLVAPRIRLEAAARDFDPATLPLTPVSLFNKSCTKLENGMEAGTVRLKSGEVVRYWFISRHTQPGSGLTRFDFPGGESVYMRVRGAVKLSSATKRPRAKAR